MAGCSQCCSVARHIRNTHRVGPAAATATRSEAASQLDRQTELHHLPALSLGGGGGGGGGGAPVTHSRLRNDRQRLPSVCGSQPARQAGRRPARQTPSQPEKTQNLPRLPCATVSHGHRCAPAGRPSPAPRCSRSVPRTRAASVWPRGQRRRRPPPTGRTAGRRAAARLRRPRAAPRALLHEPRARQRRQHHTEPKGVCRSQSERCWRV